MAEIRITWHDGRQEIRSVLPGQIVTLGDSRLPLLAEEVPIGGQIRQGAGYGPYCRMRVHGNEMPGVVLLAAKRGATLTLPSAREERKKWSP